MLSRLAVGVERQFLAHLLDPELDAAAMARRYAALTRSVPPETAIVLPHLCKPNRRAIVPSAGIATTIASAPESWHGCSADCQSAPSVAQASHSVTLAGTSSASPNNASSSTTATAADYSGGNWI